MIAIVAWMGLILTALGTIATIVGSYYTYAAYQRDRSKQTQHAAAAEHGYQLNASRFRWVWIITIAAIGIFAVGIFLITQSGSPTTPSPGANHSESAAPSQSNSSLVPSPSSSGAWSKQWGPGTLLFTVEVGPDLDSVPPDTTGKSSNQALVLLSNQYQDNNGIVSWTGNGSGTASAAACADLISTQGVSAVKPVVGSTYCAKTGQGNIAIILVKHITTDSSDIMTDTRVQVTVWSNN